MNITSKTAERVHK